VLYSLQKLGVAASQALMVGDSRYDRGAAGAAGVRFVGLGLDGDVRIEQLSELPAHLTPPR
jgi:phosphoglycolate phosphatase-like HAD superfamily hydrolase